MGKVNTSTSIKKPPAEDVVRTYPVLASTDADISINDAGHRVSYTPHEEPEYNPGPDDPEAEDEPDREGNTDPDGDLNGSD